MKEVEKSANHSRDRGAVSEKFYRPLLIFPPCLFISFRSWRQLFPLRENFNNACVSSKMIFDRERERGFKRDFQSEF